MWRSHAPIYAIRLSIRPTPSMCQYLSRLLRADAEGRSSVSRSVLVAGTRNAHSCAAVGSGPGWLGSTVQPASRCQLPVRADILDCFIDRQCLGEIAHPHEEGPLATVEQVDGMIAGLYRKLADVMAADFVERSRDEGKY